MSRCDKTACWSYGDKVYLFGGFGPPPPSIRSLQPHLHLSIPPSHFLISKLEKQGSLYEFKEDPSTVVGYGSYVRGWSNQLVAYNRTTNRWDNHTTPYKLNNIK